MASTPVISIWTIQMGKWRLAEQKGIRLLDITAKSGIPQFAPDFNNVFRYKRAEMGEEEYTRLYLERMQQSQQNYPQVWRWLNHYPEIALACYCKAGAYCHRHLFKRVMEDYLVQAGYSVVQQGELL